MESFSGLATNNFYKIVEGQSISITTDAAEPTSATNHALQISPNPVVRDFQILSGDGPAERITVVEVFDSTGRLFAGEMVRQGKGAQIHFAKGLAAGMYSVRAHFGDGSMVMRQVVKQ